MLLNAKKQQHLTVHVDAVSWKMLFHDCLPHLSPQQVDITSCPHNVSLVKTRRDIFKGTNWFHRLPLQNPVWSVSVTTADNAEMPLAGWRDGFGGRLVIGVNWGWQTDISRSTLAVPESTEANKVKTGLQKGENSSDTETVWGKFDFQNQTFQKPPKTGAGCLHGNNTICTRLRPGTPPSKLCLVASSREELRHKATKKGASYHYYFNLGSRNDISKRNDCCLCWGKGDKIVSCFFSDFDKGLHGTAWVHSFILSTRDYMKADRKELALNWSSAFVFPRRFLAEWQERKGRESWKWIPSRWCPCYSCPMHIYFWWNIQEQRLRCCPRCNTPFISLI